MAIWKASRSSFMAGRDPGELRYLHIKGPPYEVRSWVFHEMLREKLICLLVRHQDRARMWVSKLSN